jgi:hypothetical protein
MLSMQFLTSKLGVTRNSSGRRARVSRILPWIRGRRQRTTALSGEETSYSVTLPTGWPTNSAESTTAL